MSFPTNTLEELLLDASEDRLDIGSFLAKFIQAPAWVPVSGTTPEDPEIRTVRIEDKPYIRVFTSREQAEAVLPDKECVQLVLADILRRVPDDWGVVINPNGAFGFTVGAQTLRNLLSN